MTVTSLEKRFPTMSKWGLRIGSLVALAIIWEIIGQTLNSLLMPTFLETMEALFRLLGTKELWQAVWRSNQAMLIGFGASLLIGIPLGVLMGRWRQAEKFADLYLNILLVTPMAALIPIFIIAIGLNLGSRVMVVFVFAVVIVTVNSRVGLRNIDPNLVEMARSFGANEKQLWLKVLLPGALPAMMAGVRLGLGRSITGMVVVELLLFAVGVGRLILRFQGNFDAGAVYAVVFVVLAEAVLLMEFVKRVEKWLIPWESEVVVE
jgi:ABC-type nitrate/sulfonate/bicarbonate transport system permease component